MCEILLTIKGKKFVKKKQTFQFNLITVKFAFSLIYLIK